MNKEINSLSFSKSLEWLFNNTAETIVLKKGATLLREGEVEKNLYLILEGALKLFYLTEFNEKIIRLAYNGSMMNSLSSFLNNKPSEFYIEAIRESKVKFISKEVVIEVINRDQDSMEQYSKFLETMLIQQIDREIDLLIESPAMRLERVLKRSPELFQHIPLKYIASYLRMTPETLSRIRNS